MKWWNDVEKSRLVYDAIFLVWAFVISVAVFRGMDDVSKPVVAPTAAAPIYIGCFHSGKGSLCVQGSLDDVDKFAEDMGE